VILTSILAGALVASGVYARWEAKRKPSKKMSAPHVSLKRHNQESENEDPLQGKSQKEDSKTFISPAEQQKWDQEARNLNRKLMISGASFACAVGGTLFYSPLLLLSLPILVVHAGYIYHLAIEGLREDKRLTAEIIVSAGITTFVLSGFYLLGNFATFHFTLRQRLLHSVTRTSHESLTSVFRTLPRTAWLVQGNVEVEVSVEQLQTGDHVVVRAGSVIPVDGKIFAGEGSVDQHMLTGEAIPAEVMCGDLVFAGTLLVSGRLVVVVQDTGKSTTAAEIGRVLERTTDFKSTQQLKVEELADKLVLPAVVAGMVAFPFVGTLRAIALVDTHPKRSLSLSGPVSLMTYLSDAVDHGILIKDGRALELLNKVDTIVFDKTGTLTLDRLKVETIIAVSPSDETEVLAQAASIEQHQSHPIARAIQEEAERRELSIETAEEIEIERGFGLQALVAGAVVRVGSARFMRLNGLEIPLALDHPTPIQNTMAEAGLRDVGTWVYVSRGEHIIGAIELQAMLRPETEAVLRQLRRNKRIREFCILSGDHPAPTRSLAQRLKIERSFAQVSPTDKGLIIDELQAKGHSVCFIGDGINDSIALKKATVSISIRGAATIATDTAEIILMNGTLTQLPMLFEIATDYEKNLQGSIYANLVPLGVGGAGVLFLGFSFPHVVVCNIIASVASLCNSAVPMVRSKLTGNAVPVRLEPPKTPHNEEENESLSGF